MLSTITNVVNIDFLNEVIIHFVTKKVPSLHLKAMHFFVEWLDLG